MKSVWMTFTIIGWLGLVGVSSSAFGGSGREALFDIQLADQHFNKGLSLYFQKDYMGAIKEFSESININPENVKAYYFIGYSYYKLREFSKASEAFRQAYQLKADYSPVRPQSTASEKLGQD